MSHERWVDIQDFPDYAVSNFGRVMNKHTELIKTPTANQQGIPNVLLMSNRVQHRRAVGLLVAHHFISNSREAFDTPINRDGDRWNNHWQNLDWRPRWFAIEYHRQFHRPIPYGFTGALRCVESNEVYDNIIDCVVANGLLAKEVILSMQTQVPVFPTWQTFALVPNGS